ncbi:MAG TPA: sulfatase-like hydrolase/transferase [Clostridiales bacterium]|nr:sulfatase-like hydrolase/transferase [Clostridiales bacterium]
MKNIVFFFCDELRPDALGCYGNAAGDMHTPNIDSIAKRGHLFENCFCNSPVCVPSRTSIMTGLYPEDTGVYDNEAALPAFTLPGSFLTFPKVLHESGYHTASFGKTHLPPQMHPFERDNKQGSEMNLGLSALERETLHKISPRGALSFNMASLYPQDKEYYPETVTSNALDWMAKQADPYFIRISYTQPHSPIIVKRGYETIYKDYPFSGKLPDISHLSEFEQAFAQAIALDTVTEEELIQAKACYYGMVSWIDDEIGKVLHFLQAQGQLDNTILILGADHGALRGECRGLGKHIFHRASQSVPLIIATPDDKGDKRISTLCSNIDLPKTIFHLAGIEAPPQFKGVNLFSGHDPQAVYATIGYGEYDSCAFPARQLGRLSGDRGWPRRSCIRTKQYRLDMNTRVNGVYPSLSEADIFFVDCEKYPDEDFNMADDPAYAPIINDLISKLSAHCSSPVEVNPDLLHIPADMVAGTRQ